jgi:hypothetical protein
MLTSTIRLSDHPVFGGEPASQKYVYHYTRWERLLDIMETGFRLGPLAQMNDPRESKEWLLPITVSGVTFPAVGVKAAEEEIRNYKRKIRVAACCLDQPAVNRDNHGRRGYARPRMWAQYTDNHRGVCIILDRAGLDRAIRQRYPAINTSWVRGGSVQYVETPLEDVMNREMFLNSPDEAVGNVREHFARYAEQLFFTKHIDWRDENEYRWVYYDADQSQTGEDGLTAPFVDIKTHVVAVVLGADYSDAHLPIARMFAQVHNIHGTVVRCVWRGLYLQLEVFADDGSRLIVQGTYR